MYMPCDTRCVLNVSTTGAGYESLKKTHPNIDYLGKCTLVYPGKTPDVRMPSCGRVLVRVPSRVAGTHGVVQCVVECGTDSSAQKPMACSKIDEAMLMDVLVLMCGCEAWRDRPVNIRCCTCMTMHACHGVRVGARVHSRGH